MAKVKKKKKKKKKKEKGFGRWPPPFGLGSGGPNGQNLIFFLLYYFILFTFDSWRWSATHILGQWVFGYPMWPKRVAEPPL
jgi:hypothetical protein